MASREKRMKRLRQLSAGSYPATTMRYGRRYLLDHPSDGPACMLVGIALVELARYEEAEQAYAKAIEFCPPEKLQVPWWQLGHLFNNAGDHEKAAEWYQRAIDVGSGHASPYIFLGALRAKQGRFQEAEELHRAALACERGCIDEAYLNLGFILRARERFAEAAECFKEAIRRDPEYRAAKAALRDVELCMKLRSGRRYGEDDS